MELMEVLATLGRCFSPSGQETEAAKAIGELAAPYADDITTDAMGNLIVHKKGSGPKVLFAAHMDTLGLMVTHVEDSGLLRVGRLGGIEPRLMPGTPVRFQNGVMGAVYEDLGLEEKKREMGHLYIDIGAKDANEAARLVQVGDVAVFNTPLCQMGNTVFGPYLDNRVCCAALLKALSQVGESSNDLYFVFTVQEEVGLRGAQTAAFAIDPDYAVVTDVTDSDDLPGGEHEGSAKCGGGAAIKVMDTSVICHPQMVRRLRDLAQAKDIPFQMDILTDGGTDGGAIHKSRAGVYTGGVSVPCRYIHSPQEAVRLSDGSACARLLAAFAQGDLPTIPDKEV